MIYVLGDSFCFGYNFLLEKVPNYKELLCSHLLAEKLKMDYKNYSLVGSSNFRLARLINFLDIKKDDIVIIGWSSPNRMEVGVSEDKLLKEDFIVDYSNIDSLQKIEDVKRYEKLFQVIEKTEGIYTRQLFPGITKMFDFVNDSSFKNLVKYMLFYSNDKNYQEQMFRILFNSSVYTLRNTGCKFLMFTTWDVELSNTEFLNIPEYLFYNTNMLDVVRYNQSKVKHRENNDFKYWNDFEHEKVSEILYNALREKYDIQ